MKKINLIILATIILISCTTKKDQFTIQGTIADVDSAMIFLQKPGIDGWEKLDSTKVIDGNFTFNGSVALPEMWYLNLKENEVSVPLFIENAEIYVKIYPDSIDKSTIKGSTSHDIYMKYVVMDKTTMKKMEEVYNDWEDSKRCRRYFNDEEKRSTQ